MRRLLVVGASRHRLRDARIWCGQRQPERFETRRPATLVELHAETTSLSDGKSQPQRCRRGCRGGRGPTHHPGQCLAATGRDLKPPDLFGRRSGQPGEHSTAARAFECLFGTPEHVAILGPHAPPATRPRPLTLHMCRMRRTHHDTEPAQIDPPSRQRRRVRQHGRRNHHHRLARLREIAQRRCQQPPLPDAQTLAQQLRHRATRPPGARQFGVERGKAGGVAGAVAMRQFTGTPQPGRQGGKRQGHRTRKILYECTV